MLRFKLIVRPLVLALATSSCTPNDAYKSRVEALVALDTPLSKALDHVLESQRNHQRMHMMRAVLTEYALMGESNDPKKTRFQIATEIAWTNQSESKITQYDVNIEANDTDGIINEKIKNFRRDYRNVDAFPRIILCEPRWAYTQARNAQTFTTAFVTGAQDAISTSSDKPGELWNSIWSDWGSRFPNTATNGKNDSRKNCMDDLKSHPDNIRTHLYPAITGAGPELSTEAIGAAISLVEIMYDIFKAVYVQGLQEIDQGVRAKALGEWLKIENNRQHLAEALTDAKGRINNLQQYERTINLATFLAASKPFTDPNSTTYQQSKAVLATSECNTTKGIYIKNQSDDTANNLKVSPEFDRCFVKLIDVWSPNIQALLTAAAEYDKQADVKVDRSPDDFQKVIDQLGEIADGKLDPATKEGRDVLEAYFQTAVRLGGWVQQIVETGSNSDNQKKIKDAVDKLKKLL